MRGQCSRFKLEHIINETEKLIVIRVLYLYPVVISLGFLEKIIVFLSLFMKNFHINSQTRLSIATLKTKLELLGWCWVESQNSKLGDQLTGLVSEKRA